MLNRMSDQKSIKNSSQYFLESCFTRIYSLYLVYSLCMNFSIRKQRKSIGRSLVHVTESFRLVSSSKSCCSELYNCYLGVRMLCSDYQFSMYGNCTALIKKPYFLTKRDVGHVPLCIVVQIKSLNAMFAWVHIAELIFFQWYKKCIKTMRNNGENGTRTYI